MKKNMEEKVYYNTVAYSKIQCIKYFSFFSRF